MPSFNSVPFLALAVPFLLKSAQSVNVSCGLLEDETRKFTEYNGTKTYPIPALKIDGYTDEGHPNKLSEDDDNQWNLISRVSHPLGSSRDAWNRIFVDTGNSNTTDIIGCMESTSLTATTGFAFSEKVLRRSLEDKGDCKTMLGEKCVEALERQYHDYGVVAMKTFSCMKPIFNTTIPKECSNELVNGQEGWLGSLFRTGEFRIFTSCSKFAIH
ncbi:hypothetical protein BU24DRAFT_3052 [Aaosphaeria arxii CBS 175.79]|uniref:Uncharacterized protein n=1 Tax=Aaosphaeria arxii CBS 175.79 TaxID=1450172 RepID=A0A6A5Y4Q7_9PLEO|nr:uncharacterized protein BU24DRAFT_3052 [Aaosphaeria arxii CBS 175.79]KAF2020565.1 hypothetical protein BU24DRAFT_3052 [Aaosphaeria arxii CBS 175.79]